MSWLVCEPLQALAETELPSGIVAAAGPIDDFRQDLTEAERTVVKTASLRRARDFAAGRHYAHVALGHLGETYSDLTRDSEGRPAWPSGVCGSLSHTSSVSRVGDLTQAREVAIAAVARSAQYQSIGVDIEQTHRVGERLIDKILTPDEIAQARRERAEYAGLIFSAKESAYKAINPIVGEYIGFQEVAIDVSWTKRSFTIRYLGSSSANRRLNDGRGIFAFTAGYVFSLFVIE